MSTDMARVLQMKQHRRAILTLRSDFSLYDGKIIYRVTQDPSANSRQIIEACERMERAHSLGDWCTIDDLMEELQSYKIWLYENSKYIPYRAMGVPCIRQGVMRFRNWPTWKGEKRLGLDFPELARGHDFAELPDDGHAFPELVHGHDFPELVEQD